MRIFILLVLVFLSDFANAEINVELQDQFRY